MDKRIIIGIVVAAAIVGAGIFAVSMNSSNNTSSASNPTPTPTVTTTPTPTVSSASPTPTPTKTSATITYTNDGFSPATITVVSGTAVTIKNNSSSGLQFDSDPHPAHTDDPELNVGVVQPGKSMTFTPTTKGTWGYHNHLNSSDTGTIIVQ